jgi:alanine dehydrogenase
MADMTVKVKEPQPQEFPGSEGQVLFTYPPADEGLTRLLAERRAERRLRPCRRRRPVAAARPMSEIAGRMAPQEARRIERPHGGRGVLDGRCLRRAPARVVILGAGMAGNAARLPRMEAEVTVWIAMPTACAISIKCGTPDPDGDEPGLAIERLRLSADLRSALCCSGAKYRTGRCRVGSRMQTGAVLVDIRRPGWLFRTSHVTTHSDPIVDGVVHYRAGTCSPCRAPRHTR